MIVISNVINMVLQLLYYSMNHVIFLNLYRFLLKLCWINKHCQCLNAIEISYLKFPLVINYVFYKRQTHTLQAMNWIVSLCTINSKIKIKSALVKSLDQVTVLTVARCTLSKLTKISMKASRFQYLWTCTNDQSAKSGHIFRSHAILMSSLSFKSFSFTRYA